MSVLQWRVRSPRLIDAGLSFAGNLLFPRLSYRLRWHTRLGPGGTLLYVLARTGFAVVVIRFLSEVAERQEQMRAELREHLGREPTSQELFEHFHPDEPD
jgi:hypothetical protein